MNTTVTVAIITALVSAIGWVVNYIFAMTADARRHRIGGQLAHVEKQLSDLYGPLAFLIIEGNAFYRDLLTTLGREQVFQENSDLSSDEQSLWLFWVDNDFMPRNEAIQHLLSCNAHLIDNETIPASYEAFMDHYNSWRVTHLRWKEDQIKYSLHSKGDWPQEFNEDVQATFGRLKHEHAELAGLLSGRRNRYWNWLQRA